MDFYNYILDEIDLNLMNGPYITGSRCLYNIEKLFRNTNLNCSDIDIVCRNLDQKNKIEKILKKFFYPAGFLNICNPTHPWVKNKEKNTIYVFKYKELNKYKNIQKIDLIIHNVDAQTRIDSHDFTITQVACSNNEILVNSNTILDVEKRLLDLEVSEISKYSNKEKKVFLKRRKKYIKKGYKDSYNVKNILQKLMSTATF
jgi:hypothetical protein